MKASGGFRHLGACLVLVAFSKHVYRTEGMDSTFVHATLARPGGVCVLLQEGGAVSYQGVGQVDFFSLLSSIDKAQAAEG
jgi:hypothetical protein